MEPALTLDTVTCLDLLDRLGSDDFLGRESVLTSQTRWRFQIDQHRCLEPSILRNKWTGFAQFC